MLWEITIVNGATDDRQSLGARAHVIEASAVAVPGLELQRPPMPRKETLDMMPPAVCDAMARPNLEADFENEDYSIQFYIHLTLRQLTGSMQKCAAMVIHFPYSIQYVRTLAGPSLMSRKMWSSTRLLQIPRRGTGFDNGETTHCSKPAPKMKRSDNKV